MHARMRARACAFKYAHWLLPRKDVASFPLSRARSRGDSRVRVAKCDYGAMRYHIFIFNHTPCAAVAVKCDHGVMRYRFLVH